jgi:hypothetical protein
VTPARSAGARAFLVVSVFVWLPYGIYCFLVPGGLADYAGVVGETATGTTELRAMYGGLEAAIGVFALAALLRPALTSPFVLASAFLCSGLLLARLSGIAIPTPWNWTPARQKLVQPSRPASARSGRERVNCTSLTLFMRHPRIERERRRR